MRPRDRPTRTGLINKHLEEAIMIDVSMDGPEEVGENARSPSPEYEEPEEEEVLKEEAGTAGAPTRDRST